MTGHRFPPRSNALACCLCLGLALVLEAPLFAQNQPLEIVDVSPSFQPGMYTAMSVDPRNTERVAIGTYDGFVMWSENAGITSRESRVISARRYDPMTIRSGSMSQLNMPTPAIRLPGLKLVNPERTSDRSLRVFLNNISNGTPPARHSFLMSITDPLTEISDIAWPAKGGKLAAAGPAGIIISDKGRGSWLRTLGKPGPMPNERYIQGISVAINPQDGNHLVAATDQGLFVSHDGGRNFINHLDPRTIDDYVINFRFDPENPELLFAVTPGVILMSEDAGKTFEPALSTEAEILHLSLSPTAALISTTDGLQIAGADSMETLLKGHRIVGSVSWKDDSVLALSDEQLFHIDKDKNVKIILSTGSNDPFIKIDGNSNMAWILTPSTLLRVGESIPYTKSLDYDAPRLAMSLNEVEKAVRSFQKIETEGERYLHPRWYSQALPDLELTARGGLSQRTRLLYDGVFPARFFFAEAYAQSNWGWEVMAKWDLSQFIFGDTSNVVHPEMILESSMRDGLAMMLNNIRAHYREAATLTKRLSKQLSDKRLEFMWRMRLEELGAYLHTMSGKKIVLNNSLEPN